MLPLRGAENMDDDIAVIEQQPARVRRPLLVVRRDLLALKAFADLVLDGTELPFAIAAAQHEVVAETAQLADVQQDNIAGLLFAGRLRGPSGYLECLQSSLLSMLPVYYNYTIGQWNV